MKKDLAKQLLYKVKQDYNNIAADFANTRQQIWQEMSTLFDYIKKGDKVLDLGCGNGRFVDVIKEKADPPAGGYFGTDVSEKLIEFAKQKYPNEKFYATDPLKLPFSDNFFNIIYSIAVFHHIPSKEFRIEFLKEAKRVLVSGGFLILTVWRPKDKQERGIWLKFLVKKVFGLAKGLDFGDVIEPWFGNNKGERYFHCFSQKELIDLAKQAGFEIEKAGIIKNEKGNRENLFLIVKKP